MAAHEEARARRGDLLDDLPGLARELRYVGINVPDAADYDYDAMVKTIRGNMDAATDAVIGLSDRNYSESQASPYNCFADAEPVVNYSPPKGGELLFVSTDHLWPNPASKARIEDSRRRGVPPAQLFVMSQSLKCSSQYGGIHLAGLKSGSFLPQILYKDS